MCAKQNAMQKEEKMSESKYTTPKDVTAVMLLLGCTDKGNGYFQHPMLTLIVNVRGIALPELLVTLYNTFKMVGYRKAQMSDFGR